MSFMKRATLGQILNMYSEMCEHVFKHVKLTLEIEGLNSLDRLKTKEIYGVLVRTLMVLDKDYPDLITVRINALGYRSNMGVIHLDKLEGLAQENVKKLCDDMVGKFLLKAYNEVVQNYLSTIIPTVIQNAEQFSAILEKIHSGIRFVPLHNGYEYFAQSKSGFMIRHCVMNEDPTLLPLQANGMKIQLSQVKVQTEFSDTASPTHCKAIYGDIIPKVKDDLVTLALLGEIELPTGLCLEYSND